MEDERRVKGRAILMGGKERETLLRWKEKMWRRGGEGGREVQLRVWREKTERKQKNKQK